MLRVRFITFPNIFLGPPFSKRETVIITDLSEYQQGVFEFSMQGGVGRSGTKWLRQVITTKAWLPQNSLLMPELCFPNLIFIVHRAVDKGTALHSQGHFPGEGHASIWGLLFVYVCNRVWKASDGLRDYGNDLSWAKQVCHLQRVLWVPMVSALATGGNLSPLKKPQPVNERRLFWTGRPFKKEKVEFIKCFGLTNSCWKSALCLPFLQMIALMDQKQAPGGSEPREVGSHWEQSHTPSPRKASAACTTTLHWGNLLMYTYYVKVTLFIIFVFTQLCKSLLLLEEKFNSTDKPNGEKNNCSLTT